MERQLKERLIGAAVLIAVAVIMVPEMFSGSGSHDNDTQKPETDSSASSTESGQIKTYRIELQHRDANLASSATLSPPQPVVADTAADAAVANSINASHSVSESSSSSTTVAVSVSSSSQKSALVAQSSISAAHVSSSVSSLHSASSIAAGWAIQLGSFGTESTAKQLVTTAKSHGLAAYVASAEVGNKTVYRVRVGPYPDRDAAETALSKLKRSYAQASLVAPNH